MSDRTEGRALQILAGPGGQALFPQQQLEPPNVVFNFVSVPKNKEELDEQTPALQGQAREIAESCRATEEDQRAEHGILEEE